MGGKRRKADGEGIEEGAVVVVVVVVVGRCWSETETWKWL